MYLIGYFLSTQPLILYRFGFMIAAVIIVFIISAFIIPLINKYREEMSLKKTIKESWQLQTEQISRNLKTEIRIAMGEAPIFYLRPFTIDGTKISTETRGGDKYNTRLWGVNLPVSVSPYNTSLIEHNFEKKLCAEAEKIGPFIAIGKPGAKNETGAYRFYYTNKEWKDAAKRHMNSAALLFVRIEGTIGAGFDWELEQISKSFLHKTIFVIKPGQEATYSSLVKKMESFQLTFPNYDAYKDKAHQFIAFDNLRKVYFASSLINFKIYETAREIAKQRNKPNKYI